MDYGSAIHLHHVEQALILNRGEFAVLTETGVVDQQIDLESFLFREVKDLFGSVRIRQVGCESLGHHPMLSGEFLREFVQSVFPASSEHEMRATGGQLACQGHADSGASTGHQGPRPAPLSRHLLDRKSTRLNSSHMS